MFTFKNTHLIIFKAQEYLCLAIFGKPIIQVHGKTILSMEFKSIIKAHDSNPWQFIHPKPNSHWQYQTPTPIGNIRPQFSLANIKTQFLLTTSKPNFHWHYFIKKKRAQDYQTLGKGKNISCYRSKKKKDHGNHLMKKLIESYLEDYVLIL